jgi:hypothetical protein
MPQLPAEARPAALLLLLVQLQPALLLLLLQSPLLHQTLAAQVGHP